MRGIDSGRLVETPGGAEQRAADSEPHGEPLRVRGYAWLVFAIATVGVAILAARHGAGTPLPDLVPVLALGALIALSVNQFAFFPNEWSATAEAAVLVAAVVGFAGAGPRAELLGPAAVSFLCGPLDLAHWRRRAFWRMAYNSGNRMIAALLGASVFHAVQDGSLQLGLRFASAALGASLVFALVDLVIFVGFEQVRGEVLTGVEFPIRSK